jgi:phosphohistidine phosphatase
MRLLLIRHGIAETREDFARTGEGDDLRPLTRAGRRKMRRAARGLRELVPAIDTLLTSPLVRARQTADIVARVYGGPAPWELEALRPERPPDELLHWLRAQPGMPHEAPSGGEPRPDPRRAGGPRADDGPSGADGEGHDATDGDDRASGGHAGGDVTIALVGHDPHLPTLLTWLVTGQREAWLGLRKGGACLVEFRGPLEAGAGVIRWLVAPKVLRRLAKRR